ncbi:MAG: F0F1 ATP synthase subunit A [Polyangiaceae bacterium]|nr:F0F1 ATP synthase subunit A [Polyangiaceae bacterium]MBK8941321.1 F0F1 ATP synthase subunit A [Polyangiaceae bacterium]
MSQPFPVEITRFGGLVVTDTVVTSLGLSIAIVLAARIAMALPAARATMEIGYEALEGSIRKMVTADVAPLVPLIVTQWIFIGCANLAGVVPRLASPTRDLALTAALAVIAFLAGHVFALKRHGLRYLRQYIEPTPILLPLNVIGELSRTVALALRLFGNMMSGSLISAIVLYVAGLLVPVPLMLLSVLTGVVQAYIFGVLTLVFAASSLEIAGRPRKAKP